MFCGSFKEAVKILFVCNVFIITFLVKRTTDFCYKNAPSLGMLEIRKNSDIYSSLEKLPKSSQKLPKFFECLALRTADLS